MGKNNKHSKTIIASCYYLGTPLPYYAKRNIQPSKYIKKNSFDGSLDNIKSLLGDRMPNIEKDELEKLFRLFKRKYKTQKNIKFNNVNLSIYFTDWILFARDRGFSHNDYFDYEIYKKEVEEWDTFINKGYRARIFNACNDRNYKYLVCEKKEFNKLFSTLIKRDWIYCKESSFDEFKKFINRNTVVFAKPVDGHFGKGARTINIEENISDDSLNELYKNCIEENLILEEVIKQNKEVEEFNPSSINTLRINTLLCADGTPRIMCAALRIGRKDKVVDNFHSGGLAAVIDINTGIISTKAINRNHILFSVHPDSKKEILGFKFPKWDKVKDAVLQAASMLPQLGHVGWDICLTKDNDVVIIECNSMPDFDVHQACNQEGKKYLYEKYIKELEELKGIQAEPLKPFDLNIKGMELGFIKTLPRRIKRKLRKVKKFFK